jgi:hypothetical protein
MLAAAAPVRWPHREKFVLINLIRRKEKVWSPEAPSHTS